MGFDPDAYLSAGSAGPAFNPDAYLGQAAPQDPWYNRASAAIQKYTGPASRMAAKAQAAVPYVIGMANPLEGFGVYQAQKALGDVNDLAQKGGEATAEALGKRGMNPQIAAGIGTAVSMAPNVAGAFVGGPEIGSAKILEPAVPAARQAAVTAAKDLSIPMTRAEMTGSQAAAGLENFLSKTPLGSRLIQKFRDTQYAKLAEAKQGLQQTMGTPQDLYGVGQQAQTAISARDAAMNAKRGDMFNQVPENVHIPLDKSRGMADQIIQEQSQYLPTTRNGDVMAIARDIQNAGIRPTQVGAGPEYQGVTTQTPSGPEYGVKASFSPGASQAKSQQLPVVEPGSKSGSPHALFSYNDKFGPGGADRSLYNVFGDPSNPIVKKVGYGSSVTKDVLDQAGIPIVGQEPRAVQSGHQPVDLSRSAGQDATADLPSNYQQLKRAREVLGGKIQDALKSGNYAQARDYTRLKSSLDEDVQKFVNQDKGPVGNMMGDEFSQRYKQANAYSGAYKGLFKSDEANALLSAPPEKIVDLVFKRNNETAIKQFRALAGDDGFQPVKQAFTQQLLESPNVAKELAKYKQGTLSAIYSPPELSKLRRYGLAQSIPKTVSSLPGTHGSATTNVNAAQYAGAGGGLAAAAAGNAPGAVVGLGQFVAPDPLTRLYLNTSNGVNVPTNIGPNFVARAGATAQATGNSDQVIKQAMDRLLSQVRGKKK